MSSLRSQVVSGALLAACVTLCFLSSGHAQPEANSPAPETLLPQNAVVYLGWDGNAAHRESFQKTAAYDAIYRTGLIDVVKKAVDFAMVQAGVAGQVGGIKGHLEQLLENGFSFSLALPAPGPGGPPIPFGTIVFHKGANLEEPLSAFVKQAAEGEIEFATKTVEGRKVTSGMVPGAPIELGWWKEAGHLVVAIGADAVNKSIAVADGKTPNLTANPLWKKYTDGAEFEVTTVSWLDLGSIRKQFGEMPIPIPDPDVDILTANKVLQKLGLDGLGAIAARSGYKGRAMWSETTVESPGEKKGLLAFADQKPITLNDLPPLPFATNGFFACSVDWSKAFDTTVQIAKDVASLGPPDAAAQVEGVLAFLPQMLQFDPKEELLDSLGNVVCIYGDPRQTYLGIGAGLAISVKDADQLRKTLDVVAGTLVETIADPNALSIRGTNKHGRKIVTFEIGGGFMNPAYAVDDEWLVIGLMPQSVEAFLLRLDNKRQGNHIGLANWKPTRSYQQAFDELPKEFVSISVMDPRKSYRALLGAAPWLMGFVQGGMRQSGMFGPNVELPFSVADLPPAEAVARPLFPNVSMTTVDEDGIHCQSRQSLPSFPMVGHNAAVAPILVALLLPAVQQARTAARRSQSKNNLKQIALAMHNYHDSHNTFPPGTHPNADLKPEKRLSWFANLLPFIEEGNLHQQLDFKKGWEDDANLDAIQTDITTLIHPGIAPHKAPNFGATHYVGIAGVGADTLTLEVHNKKTGVFGYNRATRIRDIRDGTSNTLMVMEVNKNHGRWGAGGAGTLRAFVKKPYINGPDGFGGGTRDGANAALCDGSVRFLSSNISPEVIEALATVSGGEIVGEF